MRGLDGGHLSDRFGMLVIGHPDARSHLSYYTRERGVVSTSHLLLRGESERVWFLKRRMVRHLDQTGRSAVMSVTPGSKL